MDSYRAVSVSLPTEPPSAPEEIGSQSLVLGTLCWLGGCVYRMLHWTYECMLAVLSCLRNSLWGGTQTVEMTPPSSERLSETAPPPPKRPHRVAPPSAESLSSECLIHFHQGHISLPETDRITDIALLLRYEDKSWPGDKSAPKEMIDVARCAHVSTPFWMEQLCCIHWMFPTATPSNSHKPALILNRSTIEHFQNNPQDRRYMLLVTWKLLRLWGIKALPTQGESDQATRDALFNWTSRRDCPNKDDKQRLEYLAKHPPCDWTVQLVNQGSTQIYLKQNKCAVRMMSCMLECLGCVGEGCLAGKIMNMVKSNCDSTMQLKWEDAPCQLWRAAFERGRQYDASGGGGLL